MKKVVVLILFTGFSFCMLGQHQTKAVAAPDEYYLKKSKHQKTAAIVLLSGGALLTVLSMTIPPSEKEVNDIFSNNWVGGARYIAFFGGLGTMAGSIPLFIAAGKNRKRAFGLTGHFKIEKATTLQQSAWVKTRFPAVGIKINL